MREEKTAAILHPQHQILPKARLRKKAIMIWKAAITKKAVMTRKARTIPKPFQTRRVQKAAKMSLNLMGTGSPKSVTAELAVKM